MPVYPLKIQLGPLVLTGFGFMMALAFFVAGYAMQRELERRKLSDAYAWDIVFAAVIGGIVGAKLWYAALHGDAGSLLSTSGLVWYGGFFGGVAGVAINGWRRGVPIRFTMELTAPALAVGYALGRVGCFLVQDDYGIPTDLPWAMRFPQGLPASTAGNLAAWGVEIPPGAAPFDVLAVHPTQLYEVVAMLAVFWVLWRLRTHRHASGWLCGAYLACAGIERFLVEFVRAKDDRLLGPFTLAQAASLSIALVGVALLVTWWRDEGLRLQPVPPVLRAQSQP